MLPDSKHILLWVSPTKRSCSPVRGHESDGPHFSSCTGYTTLNVNICERHGKEMKGSGWGLFYGTSLASAKRD